MPVQQPEPCGCRLLSAVDRRMSSKVASIQCHTPTPTATRNPHPREAVVAFNRRMVYTVIVAFEGWFSLQGYVIPRPLSLATLTCLVRWPNGMLIRKEPKWYEQPYNQRCKN